MINIMNRNGLPIVASFDLDGVLYDFPKAIGEHASFEPDLTYWSMGLSDDDFKGAYESFKASGGFRKGDRLIESARIQGLIDRGVEVLYTTARSEAQRADTVAWLDEHGFPGELVCSDDKTVITNRSYFGGRHIVGIDDKGSNAVAMAAAGIETYLVRYPYNLRDRLYNHRPGNPAPFASVDSADAFVSLLIKRYG